jgi:putative membrane protein
VTANLIGAGRAEVTGGGVRGLIGLAAISAVVMTAWDLVIDPILSGPSARAWIWETGGPYFGIPIQNYSGWLLTTFSVYLAYRWLARRWAGAAAIESGRAASAVWVLPVAAYGLMLVADLLSGAAPAGLVVIGPVVMGVPLVVAVGRILGPSDRATGDNPDQRSAATELSGPWYRPESDGRS